MPRAAFLAAAQRDLLALRRYLTREGGSLTRARDFTDRLRQRCDDMASLPGTLGRARTDLGADIRSLAWRGYVILFRYAGGQVQVVRILHGQRDLPRLVHPTSEG
jgi:plasmid stabilization system protein ParE